MTQDDLPKNEGGYGVAAHFAREIIGWGKAPVWEDEFGAIHGQENAYFNPGNLKFIMESAKAWCDRNDHYIECKSVLGEGWNASVTEFASKAFPKVCVNQDLGTAIMTACLEAKRAARLAQANRNTTNHVIEMKAEFRFKDGGESSPALVTLDGDTLKVSCHNGWSKRYRLTPDNQNGD